MSLYLALFSRNPITDLLVSLVGLDAAKHPEIEDAFVRYSALKAKTKKAVQAAIKADKPMVVMGDTECLITIVVSGQPKKMKGPIYYLSEEQDPVEKGYWYVNYRIPAKFRDALSKVAWDGEWRIGERIKNRGEMDSFAEHLVASGPPTRAVLQKILGKQAPRLTLAKS